MPTDAENFYEDAIIDPEAFLNLSVEDQHLASSLPSIPSKPAGAAQPYHPASKATAQLARSGPEPVFGLATGLDVRPAFTVELYC